MSAHPIPSTPLSGFYTSAFFMDGAFFLILGAIPFKVLDLGGGPVALGLVPALAALTYIALTPLTGRWSDRWGRSWFCLTGNLILIGFTFLAYRCHSLDMLLVIMPLMGVGKACYWPIVQSAVGDLSGPERLTRNIGLFNVAWSSGKAVGFLTCGILMSSFDFGPTFLVGGTMVVLAFLFLPRGPARKAANLQQETNTDSPPLSQVSRRRRQTFRHMAWLANLAAFGAAGVLGHHLPKWFAHLGWQEDRFGLFLAAIFLVQTITFWLLAGLIPFTYSARRLLTPQLAAGGALLALPLLTQFWQFLLLAPLLGVSLGISYAGSIYYSLHTPTARGWYAGIHESLTGVGGFVPPLLGGFLARWTGWLGCPYVLAGGGVLFALFVQWLLYIRLQGRSSLNPEG